jgi:hypothetical protein
MKQTYVRVVPIQKPGVREKALVRNYGSKRVQGVLVWVRFVLQFGEVVV